MVYQVKIALEHGAKMPLRSTEGAAAWDLFAHINEPVTLYPGDVFNIPTGIKVQLPRGHFWDVRIRSGLSTRYGIMLVNGAGVVDEDYRGIVHVPVIHLGDDRYKIQPGEKIGQAILQKYCEMEFAVVDQLDDTERGEGGFGSTGK